MAHEELNSLWDSVPWQEWTDSPDASSSTEVVGWYKPSVPYVKGGHELQTLDLWLPSPSLSTPSTEGEQDAPEQVLLSQKNNTANKDWIVYIHGGAWCDPHIRAHSFGFTLHHLLNKFPSAFHNIAGIASLNYTLSPSEHHGGGTPSRSGKHPDHIVDVLRGLAFIQNVAGFKENYVLLGHSCGATLAFQVLMNVARWSPSPEPPSATAKVAHVAKPSTVIGLDGLYDLPGLIKDPGEKHARWIPEYEAFTRFAFGDNQKTWYDISPVSVKDWVAEWGPEHGTVVLVQSKDDTLVPYRQLEGMREALKPPAVDESIVVFELPAKGDHDSLWQTGDQIAGIIDEVLKRRRH